MGKHKNRIQNKIILEFMEKYPDLAKGFTKRDKRTVDALWIQLTKSINAAGPPQYDVNGWRKKWIEWKSEVKRKLVQNKVESMATCGGSYVKHLLTPTEEVIVRLTGMAQFVEGVSGFALGVKEDGDVSIEEEIPSTSSKRPLSTDLPSSTSKKLRTENTNDRLKNFFDEDSKIKLELNEKLEELIKIELQNATSLRLTYKAIEKVNESVARAVNDLKKEFSQFSEGILKYKQEKIDLMKRQLDMERQKFEFEKNRNNF